MNDVDLSGWDIVDELLLMADEDRTTKGKSTSKIKRRGIVPGYVYVLKSPSTGLYKIGCTTRLKGRFMEFKTASPEPLQYECSNHFPDMYKAETHFHEEFAERRVRGEWFALNEADLAQIKAMILYPLGFIKMLTYLNNTWGETHVPREWWNTDMELKMHHIALCFTDADDELIRDCREMLGWDENEVFKNLNVTE